MRRFIKGFLLVVFGVGLALGVSFIILRVLGHDEMVMSMILHPCTPAEGDWRDLTISMVNDYREPCSRFYWDIYPTGEYYNLISLNNYGLHDTNLTMEKPKDTFRILILGDSFPQGWQVKLEQGFPWLMEEELNQTSPRKIEVINMSADTYGTDRELLLFAALGWRFQPDLVLLSFYTGNDIKDNSFDLSSWAEDSPLTHPLFTLNNAGRLQMHNAPIINRNRFVDSPAWDWLVSMVASARPLPTVHIPTAPRVKTESPRELEYPLDLGLYLPDDPQWADAWKITEVLILQLRDLVEQQGAQFGVFVIPDRRAVETSDWDSTVGFYPFMQGRDPLAPGKRITTFLESQDIPVLNMTYTLRGWILSHPSERVYYSGDGHYNANGHAVTAQRIEFWLQEAGLVP
jgi:hypothetical protein